jgi:hypothetical protein
VHALSWALAPVITIAAPARGSRSDRKPPRASSLSPRFHGSPWAKFKTVAYNNKVSWYGVSSPKEWWAEQYAHYYRTEKTGGGLIDAANKKVLDDLDKKQFLPTNASGTQGISFGSDAQVAMAQPGSALRREPAMFPW